MPPTASRSWAWFTPTRPISAQRFATDEGATWPLVQDADNSAWQAYGGALVPTTYYIDRQGIVRAVSYGPPPSGTLEELLAKIL